MLLDNFDAKNVHFVVNSAIHFNAKTNKNHIQNRKQSSLLYIIKGKYRYFLDDKIFTASDNDVIYLPYDATYNYEILTPGEVECLQFEFYIINNKTGLQTSFTNNPTVLPVMNDYEIKSIFNKIKTVKIEKPYGYEFCLNAQINLLIYHWMSESKKDISINEKIQPAVLYIKKHYKEKICVPYLATICYISNSQLWRIFKHDLKASPLEYKNELLFCEACELLKSSECNIGEISDSLGFDSVYSFSQMFKRRFGISPMKYRSTQNI